MLENLIVIAKCFRITVSNFNNNVVSFSYTCTTPCEAKDNYKGYIRGKPCHAMFDFAKIIQQYFPGRSIKKFDSELMPMSRSEQCKPIVFNDGIDR